MNQRKFRAEVAQELANAAHETAMAKPDELEPDFSDEAHEGESIDPYEATAKERTGFDDFDSDPFAKELDFDEFDSDFEAFANDSNEQDDSDWGDQPDQATDDYFRRILDGTEVPDDSLRTSVQTRIAAKAHAKVKPLNRNRKANNAHYATAVPEHASSSERAKEHFRELLQRHRQCGLSDLQSLIEMTHTVSRSDFYGALPVVSALVARVALKPALRGDKRSLPAEVRRRMIHSASRATQTLLQQGSPSAIQLLPRIANAVAKSIASGHLALTSAPAALQQHADQILARSDSKYSRSTCKQPTSTTDSSPPKERVRRLVLQGPVEIRIFGR